MLDGCSTCSGYPIIMTSFAPGRRFGHVAAGSALFSATPFNEWRHFDFRISAAGFSAALDETNLISMKVGSFSKLTLSQTQRAPLSGNCLSKGLNPVHSLSAPSACAESVPVAL